MIDNQETQEKIAAEVRDLSKSIRNKVELGEYIYVPMPTAFGKPLDVYYAELADRIEAARTCEVQSLQGTIVKLNDAIAEKQELNENSKSAQFEFCKFQRLLKAVRCLCDEVFNYMKVCNPSVAGGCELRRALENVKDALALFSNSLKNENSDDAIITPVNNAACRNALEIAKKAICNHARANHICDSLAWENSTINANCGDILCAHRDLCEAKTAIQKALAAPPRNCDVGTE